MKIFIDASLFLRLLLNEPGADDAEKILNNVESNRLIGYTTPMVLEEISFKIIFAEASHLLNTKNIWRIREALKHDKNLREKCFNKIWAFKEYILHLTYHGLRIIDIRFQDYLDSLEYIHRYGLLPADAIHLAVAKRLDIKTIATFDEDFRLIEGFKIIP